MTPVWIRHAVGATSMLLGTAGVLGMVVVINSLESHIDDELTQDPLAFQVAPKPKKPPAPKKRPKPKPKKRSNKPPPPLPALTSGLSGVEIDLPMLGAGMLEAASGDLLGDARDVVMTEEAMDDEPVARRKVAPEYPSRARAKGIQGVVHVSLLVGADGSVRDARVVSAEPQGVFEQAALEAARRWEFEPVMYEGRAVSWRRTLPFEFRLE